MNGPLENTISAHHRFQSIQSRLYVRENLCSHLLLYHTCRQSPLNLGDMQKQSWTLASDDHVIAEDDGDFDDDNDVQTGNNTFYKLHHDRQGEEEHDVTCKPGRTQKTARQTMIERKLNEADARGQIFTYVLDFIDLSRIHP